MDSPRIDRLARRLADGTSRRTVIQGIVGGIAALAAHRGESVFSAPPCKVAGCHYGADTLIIAQRYRS